MKSIVQRTISPSFVVGFAIVSALILISAHLCHYMVPYYKIDGHIDYLGESLLRNHPWLVVAGCIVGGVLALLGDAYYRTVITSHRAILTGLQAIIAPILIMLIIIKVAPEKSIDPDIPAIQEHLFGEYGTFLKEADKITLYSTHIDPYQIKEGIPKPELFHNHEIYGSTIIEDSDTIQAIALGLQNRIHWKSDVSIWVGCWWPRHGLRVHKGNEIYDYHICFQCSEMHIFKDIESGDIHRQTDPNNSTGFTLISSHKIDNSTPTLLNDILDKAGIERDRSSCK